MSRSVTNLSAKEILLQLKRLVSRPRAIRSQDGEEEREYLLPKQYPAPDTRSLHCLPPTPQLEIGSFPTSDVDDATFIQQYAAMAQELLSSLPPPYRLSSPEDVKPVGEHPVAAGRFANLWMGTYKGRKVGLKEYRCYVSFDVDRIIARFCNEVYVCNLLRNRGVDVVPFMGVYSTEQHPLVLVYEYADNLDLRNYLRNEPNVRKLDLLVAIAKCLRHMHAMDIVHGHLETTNVLVDKCGTARIAGLSNASILPYPTARMVEGKISVGCVPFNSAPEWVQPEEPEFGPGSSLPTKASDVHGFGVIAWEVLVGRPPFFEMTEVAATYSMLSGARPSRPDNREVSDLVWRIIEGCWHSVASRRMPIEEVVPLLEAEQSHIPTSVT